MERIARILIPLLALASLTPYISSPVALASGMAAALIFGNPYADRARRFTPRILSFSIIGLGAGMNLMMVAQAGYHGIAYTIVGISSTLLAGFLLARAMGTPGNTSTLITVGTAICGGSAIAAVASPLRAQAQEVSVALATVFFLNALALLIFPPAGHWLGLNETQFGVWSALAIHDTSSVVGATMQYGSEALQVGTTVKLARALWIVPLTLAIGFFRRSKNVAAETGKIQRPWFIVGFIAAAAVVTWVPSLQEPGHVVEWIAKRTFVLTLFLIGAGLTKQTLKSVGWRPMLHGVILWIAVTAATLGAISTGWIR